MKSKSNLFKRVSLVSSVPAFVVICLGASALGIQAATWTGTTSTAWNTGTNWDTNAVPNGAAAVITTSTGNIATVSANPTSNPGDVIVGSATGQTGRLDHTAGTLTTGSWVKIGHNGGDGTYNLANTGGSGGTLTGLGQGTGSLSMTGGEFRLGGDGATTTGNGTFNMHTTGSFTVNNGQVRIGRNGNGTLNIDSGTFSKTGSGNIEVGGTSGRTGTLKISGGTINNSGEFQVGNNSGAGVVTMSGGAINTSSWVGIGHSATGSGILNVNAGTLTKTGNGTDFIVGDASTGTLNQTGGDITVAGDAAHGLVVAGGVATGNYNMSGGTLGLVSRLCIGKNASSNGTFTLSSTGAVTTSSFVSVGRTGGTGVLTVNGGTVTKTGTDAFAIGEGSTGTMNQTNGTITMTGEFWLGSDTGSGSYNMSGGTLNTSNWFVVGRNGSGVGTLTMTGGTINKVGTNDLVVGADNATANGTIVQSAGLINVSGGNTNIGKGGGTGVLTLSSTAEFRSNQMVLGVGTGNGTVNFNGGTLKTAALSGGGGTSAFHFNGGTLQATANSTTFVSGLGTADILAGGATIDTQAFDVTASQIFSGAGTLTKTGSGTLTLTGYSTHNGLTQVSNGKLVVHTRGFTEAGDFTVADGKTLGVTRRAAEETLNVTSLAFGTTAATATLEMNLGDFGNPISGSATLIVDGNLAVNANTTINVTDSRPELGSFPLIQFNTRSGTGAFTLGSLPPGVEAHLDETIDSNAIYLVIDQAKLLEWDDSELSGGVWNTTNSNWNDLLTSAPAVFTTSAPVSFLDLGTVDSVNPPNPNVVIDAAGVSPGNVTFNNSTLAYSITGAGGINGTGGLLKQGTGTVTMDTFNSYTGVTRLEAGVLSVASIANAGDQSGIGAPATTSPANLVFAGGGLDYTGTATSTNRGFSLAGINSTISTAADLTILGQVTATGTSNLIKNGAGNLIFSGAAANTIGTVSKGLRINGGGVTFNGTGTNTVAGELWIGDPASTGNSSLTVSNSNLTSGSWIAIGVGNGTTGLSSDVTFTNSTVTQNGGGFSMGYSNGLAGFLSSSSLTLNSSTVNTVNVDLGRSTGSTAVCTLNGASTINASAATLIGRETAVGTLTIKNSSVYNSANLFYIGTDAGSTGNVTVSDSAAISIPGDNEFRVGASGTGTLTQTGGTISGNGWMSIGRNGGSTGTFNLSGGTFTQANAGRFMHVAETGNGTLTISGTGSFIANSTTGLIIADGAASNGTVNLNGGTLTANAVLDNASGTSSFNFDGGLLKAGSAANAVFMNGVDTVTVKAGGARIDSNGHNIAINPALLDGGTGGGLVKSGTGDLTLAGVNTYTGNTTVNDGSLILADNAQLKFVIGANGVSNTVNGTGTVQVNGDFNIDTTGANTTPGNMWTLVNVGTLAETFSPTTFTVVGFTGNSGVWTKTDGGNLWTFTEATGVLKVEASSAYSTWASANAGGQAANLDFDNDGMSNGIEFFMGATGSGFTSNPSVVAGQIAWPKSAGFAGTYRVETSADLITWTNVTGWAVDNGTSVTYTLPTVDPKQFVRLVVTPN